MLKIEVNSRKKMLRTTISTLISTSILVGCGPLVPKPTTETSASAEQGSNQGYCYKGGRASEYSCDPDKASTQADMRITEVDEVWMSAKLTEVRTWMEKEKQAIINGEKSSPTAAGDLAAIKVSDSKEFISTVSIATPTPQHSSPELIKILRLSQQGQHQEALASVNTVIADNPNMASAQLTKGIISSNMGNKSAAKAIFKRLMQDYPDRPEAFNNLAVIYSEEGNFPQAIETLQQAFQTHPSYAQVHSNLKELYATLASQAYSKALDLGSESESPDLAMINRVPTSLSSSTEKLIVVGNPKPVHKPIQIASNSTQNTPTAEIRQSVKATKEPEVKASSEEKGSATQASKSVEVVSLTEKPAQKMAEVTPAKPLPTKAVIQKDSSDKTQAVAKISANSDTASLSDAQQIENNLNNWANAWSSKDHQGYISAYTKLYRPNAKLSHNQWVKQREQRINKPKFIRVDLNKISVKLLRENLAEARFEQRYQSDTYKDAVRKRMILIKADGQWKISLEKSLGLIK